MKLPPNLLCTVRACRQALQREGGQMICPQGHSFDIARSGYINLLQPQDRRSKHPGDTPQAVAARRALHDAGFTKQVMDAILEVTAPDGEDAVLDVGAGDGFHLGNLVLASGCSGCGIDISVPAMEAAARRYMDCQWVVANGDRFLPYPDESFTIVMSITARMNPAEFQRVLARHGKLLVAVPAPDDLIELRGVERDRAGKTIETFTPRFELVKQRRVSCKQDIDAEAVESILLTVYRPLQKRAAFAQQVTFSLDLLVFQQSECNE